MCQKTASRHKRPLIAPRRRAPGATAPSAHPRTLGSRPRTGAAPGRCSPPARSPPATAATARAAACPHNERDLTTSPKRNDSVPQERPLTRRGRRPSRPAAPGARSWPSAGRRRSQGGAGRRRGTSAPPRRSWARHSPARSAAARVLPEQAAVRSREPHRAENRAGRGIRALTCRQGRR